MDQPLISIVMPYVSRASQLARTLTSFARQNNAPSYEVVIVNDGPMDDQLRDLCAWGEQVMGTPIRLFNTGRTYNFRGPAYPWNCAARAARGQILLLQSPEIMHVGEVMAEMYRAMEGKQRPYYCARCLSLSAEDTGTIMLDEIGKDSLRRFTPANCEVYVGETNPRLFYFCAGILKADFEALGGLEEGFQYLAYEDDYFAFLVRRNKYDCRILNETDSYVMHQYHERPICNGYYQAANQSKALLDKLVAGIIHYGRPAVANPGRPWGQLPPGAEVPLK